MVPGCSHPLCGVLKVCLICGRPSVSLQVGLVEVEPRKDNLGFILVGLLSAGLLAFTPGIRQAIANLSFPTAILETARSQPTQAQAQPNTSASNPTAIPRKPLNKSVAFALTACEPDISYRVVKGQVRAHVDLSDQPLVWEIFGMAVDFALRECPQTKDVSNIVIDLYWDRGRVVVTGALGMTFGGRERPVVHVRTGDGGTANEYTNYASGKECCFEWE